VFNRRNIGVLIVEDAVGEVPPFISELEEVVLVFNHIDITILYGIQQLFNSHLLKVRGDVRSDNWFFLFTRLKK
jgi:hypothetical protein